MYTKKHVIKKLQQTAHELGETPSSTYWGKNHIIPSLPVVVKLFGTWNNALRAAGLPPKAIFDYTHESLISKLQAYAQMLGRSPTRAYWEKHHIKPTAPTYGKVFGSWNEALKIAGLATNRENVTREQVAADILRVAEELGYTPMLAEYLDLSGFSPPTVYKYLGHWHEAIEKLGLEPAKSAPVTKKRLLASIQAVVNDLGKIPTATIYGQHPGGYPLHAVHKFFDTYDDALAEIGLEPPPDRWDINKELTYSNEELLDKLISIANKIGHTPTGKECSQHGLYPGTLWKRFGSFRDALKLVGLKLQRKARGDPWSKTEILEAIRAFFSEHRRPPTQKSVNCGMPAHQVITREFGSYQEARKLAGVPQPVHIPVRKQCTCKDGHIVQSMGEVKVDDFLFEHDIPHAVQVYVCSDRQWTCDFVVKDLWIEVDGFRKGRQGKLLKLFEEKIAYYKEHVYDLLIVHPHIAGWEELLLSRVT